jgi:carboxyl-terminal processing protease
MSDMHNLKHAKPLMERLVVMNIYQMFFLIYAAVTLVHPPLFAKPAEITAYDVTTKMHQIMKEHATYKKISPVLARRALQNFINMLDTQKTYFLEKEIHKWLEPDEELLQRITKDFEYSRFPEFEEIFALMEPSVQRRMASEERISKDVLPKNVLAKEVKDPTWCKNEEELYGRLLRMRALRIQATQNLDDDLRNQTMQLLLRGRLIKTEKILPQDKEVRQQFFCTCLLKAFAGSLDAHTVYFTPGEASQFLISVQQRLTGIGVQLRDDVDGFAIIKIIEGGPAQLGGELKLGDKIIAINRDPVIGFEGLDVVEMIRGKEGSEVVLTIIRETKVGDTLFAERKEVRLKRGEVVIKDSRVETALEPFGEGVIAILKLHAFYQDADSSSSVDMAKAFEKISKGNKVKGVVLDLRCNAGGLLTQAVEVVGLFIQKGIVASIKDENGHVQHYRNVDTQAIWNGPLVVLVDRLSASAAEIVAGALQDYGRAILVGDDHTYGKGSYQTFTLTATDSEGVDPKGEYKVTRGRYYTVSGKTPQLVGVQSDIVIPGGLSFLEVGEEFGKYPLENDAIGPNFVDDLSDVPFFHRDRIRRLYQFNQNQPELCNFRDHIELLKKNSALRLGSNKAFQKFVEQCKKLEEGLQQEPPSPSDFQMLEALSVMKDFIWIQYQKDYDYHRSLDQPKLAI